MELLVGCALGIVVYCSYLTMRDTLNDLRGEGIFLPRRAAVPVRVRQHAADTRVSRVHFYD